MESVPFDSPWAESLMVTATVMLLVKTFFFLRIFNGLTRLVIMISVVVNGLGPFLLFYLILTLMCSNILSILGLANYSAEQLEGTARREP